VNKSLFLTGLALTALVPAITLAQAPGYKSAVIMPDCDYDCLLDYTTNYIEALENRNPDAARLAPDVKFSENNVLMPVGNDGLWGTISGVRDGEMMVADEETGNAAWFGIVEEHGNPAYLAMRIKVEDRLITEIETVVNRLPDMPKPFGDPDAVTHDPEFSRILPVEERRSRARLVAVADGYFNTVELNDGDVFTQFSDDCGRLENGISTTSAPRDGNSGNSASIAQGCENQFKLGIYHINKRIRDRRYPIVDVDRGVVVASGFFDHANMFDRYALTDGREMKTVLKWPNSISLLEAFRIRNGEISRIEAVFTYVPYFMPSPFAVPNVDFQTR
jgi:hypothetical protein